MVLVVVLIMGMHRGTMHMDTLRLHKTLIICTMEVTQDIQITNSHNRYDGKASLYVLVILF